MAVIYSRKLGDENSFSHAGQTEVLSCQGGDLVFQDECNVATGGEEIELLIKIFSVPEDGNLGADNEIGNKSSNTVSSKIPPQWYLCCAQL